MLTWNDFDLVLCSKLSAMLDNRSAWSGDLYLIPSVFDISIVWFLLLVTRVLFLQQGGLGLDGTHPDYSDKSIDRKMQFIAVTPPSTVSLSHYYWPSSTVSH